VQAVKFWALFGRLACVRVLSSNFLEDQDLDVVNLCCLK